MDCSEERLGEIFERDARKERGREFPARISDLCYRNSFRISTCTVLSRAD